MLVMALASIVSCFAVPSYQHLIAKTRVKLACEQLGQAVATARQVALNHQSGVMLCGGPVAGACDTDWLAGQQVRLVPENKLIRAFPELPQGIAVAWRSNLQRNEALAFKATGVLQGQWGSFWVRDRTGASGRVIVNMMGQVTLSY